MTVPTERAAALEKLERISARLEAAELDVARAAVRRLRRPEGDEADRLLVSHRG